jgi:histidyl-tRNA synthetase
VSRSPLKAPRGTRDFYPEEMRLRSWLFAHCREVSRRFGYQEVDAPILEHAELFTRKAGEEIVEQLYHFELHGRRLALRGEMTPSLARMAIARAGALPLPLRWSMIGQNWRYERTTRGRRREHYQWNLEILGEGGVGAEAELAAALSTLFERLGLAAGDVRLHVSSRALLEELLAGGVLRRRPEAFAPLCVVIDKLERIGRDAVLEQLQDPAGLVRIGRAEAEEVVDALSARTLEELSGRLGPGSRARADLERFFALLEAYGVADRAVFDASVVRGLAYYTGIVFEAYPAGRRQAVAGGGRYDRLLEALGGPPLPAAGFGLGDERVLELLAERGLAPRLERGLEDVVVPLSPEAEAAAIRLATRLRAEGRSVELVLGGGRPKRVLADADREGAQRVLLIGPDELARGVARIRDLRARADLEIPLPDR